MRALAFCFLAATLLMSCAARQNAAVLAVLRSSLAAQFHACVPLGWNPVPVAHRYFYAGYTTEYIEDGVWLHPAWLGVISKSALNAPDVKTAQNVLAALERDGLVVKQISGKAVRYRLTMQAMPYFFTDNRFGNNPLHLPYLCYSRISPARVLSVRHGTNGNEVVSFDWKNTAPAAWGLDPVIQKHSVILPPVSAPATAVISTSGEWTRVTRLWSQQPMLPMPVSAAAWPSHRSH